MATIEAKKKAIIQQGTQYRWNPEDIDVYHSKYPWVHEVSSAQEILDNIKPIEKFGGKLLVFDTETHPHFTDSHNVPGTLCRRWVGTGKQAVPQDYPFSIQVYDGHNAYALYDSIENDFKEFKKLSPLFEDSSIDKIAHNIKFDMHMLHNIGMVIKGTIHDTIVLLKLANENLPSYELKKLAAIMPNGIEEFEYMVENYKKTHRVSDYRSIPKDLLTLYGCADVFNAYQAFDIGFQRILDEGLLTLYMQEMDNTVVLYSMERKGMLIDKSYETTLKDSLSNHINSIEEEIYTLNGGPFNMNSTAQLYNFLIKNGVNENDVPTTAKGNPSLDKHVLESLVDKNYHAASLISEYRKDAKLLTTYAIGIYSQHDEWYRIHSNINQTEATTGRQSITKPALQTLPKEDTRVRVAFVPANRHYLVFMDLDQIEYRLYAHYANIPSLLESIKNGYDVHAAIAAMLYNIDLDQFLKGLEEGNKEYKKLRGIGKTINFALIYGVGKAHLGELLKMPAEEASIIKNNYFRLIPEGKRFIMQVHDVISVRGYVKNFYGRRRRLSANDSYKAPNSLIQGCAADYIKSKLNIIYRFIKFNNLSTRIINIVHDEIIFEVPEEEMPLIGVLRYLLSEFEAFRCPITAGIEIGQPSWGTKRPVKEGEFSTEFKKPDNWDFLSESLHDGHIFNNSFIYGSNQYV